MGTYCGSYIFRQFRTTAVGAPIGGIIAGVGQLPSLGYQAGRGWYKIFKESPSNFESAVWNTLETGADILGTKFATTLTKGGSKLLKSSVHKPDYYPKHHSPKVNAMRKRQVDVVLNQQKKETTKKLAKKGVRPSQGSYFTSKWNQELNRSYLEQVAKRNTIIANDVIKLSPKIQLPIQIIPNIIDIHARIIFGVNSYLKHGVIRIYLKTITIIENTIMTNLQQLGYS